MKGVLRVSDAGKEALTIRRASAADAPAVLELFDEVIAWFVAIGNPQQWVPRRGRPFRAALPR